MKEYISIALTIIFTVIGQVLTKIGTSKIQVNAEDKIKLVISLIKAVFNPYIFLGLSCAVVAAFCWINVLTKLKLSFAYPFLSFSYVLVLLSSFIFLGENIKTIQWVGVGVISLGIVLISRA